MIEREEYRAYLFILGCVILWCAVILIPPIITSVERPPQKIAQISYQFFSSICHQFETRSLAIFGHKLAVCARCSGIYLGALIGVLLYPVTRYGKSRSLRAILIIAALPMLADVLLDFSGIHECSIGTRLATGAFFGIGSSVILLPIAIEAVRNILFHSSQQQGAQYESKTR